MPSPFEQHTVDLLVDSWGTVPLCRCRQDIQCKLLSNESLLLCKYLVPCIYVVHALCPGMSQERGYLAAYMYYLSMQVERNKQRKAELHRESREGSKEELQKKNPVAGLASCKSTLLAQQ